MHIQCSILYKYSIRIKLSGVAHNDNSGILWHLCFLIHMIQRQPFAPTNNPGKGQWLRRDVEAAAECLNTEPVWVDADYSRLSSSLSFYWTFHWTSNRMFYGILYKPTSLNNLVSLYSKVTISCTSS